MKRYQAIAFLLSTAMTVSTAVPAFAAASDINGHWAQATITEWQNAGRIGGYEDGTFRPDQSITRAEFVRLLNSAISTQGSAAISFSDVSPSDWYYNDVAKAVGNNIASGFEDGTFRPNETVTRMQAAVFISNALKLSGNEAGANGFTDAAQLPAWAKGAVGAVVAGGYMSGYPDGSFGGSKGMTRAEAVSTLDRVLKGGNVTEVPSDTTEPTTPSEDSTTTSEAGNMVWESGGKGSSSSSGGGGGSSSSSSSQYRNVTLRASNVSNYTGRTLTGTTTVYVDANGIDLSSIKFNGDVRIYAQQSTATASAYEDAAVAAAYLTDINVIFGSSSVSGDIIVVSNDIADSQVVIQSAASIRTLIARAATKIAGTTTVTTVEASAPVATESGTTVTTIEATTGATIEAAGQVRNIETAGTVAEIVLSGSTAPNITVSGNVTQITLSDTASAKITVNNGATVTQILSTSTQAGTTVSGNGTVTQIVATNPSTITDNTGAGVTEAQAQSIAVASQPSKLIYQDGEALDLTGLAVTITYTGGATKTVALADFAAEGITTTPANGATLTAANNGAGVTITMGSLTTTTSALTVAGGGTTTPETGVTSVTVAAAGDATTVVPGGTLQFSATVNGDAGVSQEVTWAVSGNNSVDTTIDESGLLTVAADEDATSLTVTATSVADTSKSGTATVSVEALVEVTSVTVEPASENIAPTGTLQFKATVAGTNNTQDVTWKVESDKGALEAGTEISDTGLLTVGATEAENTVLTVTATSVDDTSKFGTATVTVAAAVDQADLTTALGYLTDTAIKAETPTVTAADRKDAAKVAEAIVTAANTVLTDNSVSDITATFEATDISGLESVVGASADVTGNINVVKNGVSGTAKELTINVTVGALTDLTSANVTGFVAPATGATPIEASALTAGTGYTVTDLQWKDELDTPVGATFEADKTYTATVTLTAATGYQFQDSPAITPTVDAGTAKEGVVASVAEGNTLVFDVEFPATTAPATQADVTLDAITVNQGDDTITVTISGGGKFDTSATKDMFTVTDETVTAVALSNNDTVAKLTITAADTDNTGAAITIAKEAFTSDAVVTKDNVTASSGQASAVQQAITKDVTLADGNDVITVTLSKGTFADGVNESSFEVKGADTNGITVSNASLAGSKTTATLTLQTPVTGASVGAGTVKIAETAFNSAVVVEEGDVTVAASTAPTVQQDITKTVNLTAASTKVEVTLSKGTFASDVATDFATKFTLTDAQSTPVTISNATRDSDTKVTLTITSPTNAGDATLKIVAGAFDSAAIVAEADVTVTDATSSGTSSDVSVQTGYKTAFSFEAGTAISADNEVEITVTGAQSVDHAKVSISPDAATNGITAAIGDGTADNKFKVSFTGTPAQIAAAQSYTITIPVAAITAESNYTAKELAISDIEVTVTGKTLTASEFAIASGKDSQTYGNVDVNDIVEYTGDANDSNAGTITVTFKDDQDADVPEITKAPVGTYKIIVSTTAGTVYAAASDIELSDTLEITGNGALETLTPSVDTSGSITDPSGSGAAEFKYVVADSNQSTSSEKGISVKALEEELSLTFEDNPTITNAENNKYLVVIGLDDNGNVVGFGSVEITGVS